MLRGRIISSPRHTNDIKIPARIHPRVNPWNAADFFDIENIRPEPVGFRAIIDDITDSRRQLVRDTFSGLLEASLLKDQDTGMHIARVNEYSRVLAEELVDKPGYSEVNREFIETIGFVAAMHDVGKIRTPDDILNKGASLDEWEWEIMKEHTKNGAYILNRYPSPMASQVALFHHERWDGSGYPYSISADLIPLAARIVSMADVYDALRMERVYKPAFSHADALEELEQGIQAHFDPNLAFCFLENRSKMNSIFENISD
ncbi:MAG: phosphohydrolase [Spirochaetales bacterium]|nr:phosphohydrolase [Spirochaetales bacterium]